MSQVVLGMFVRNEAAVVERALASVRSLVSYWVVIDTGSTDGTQDAVRRALDGVPGELQERQWSSYGEMSDDLLRLAEGKGDYLWILDADEEAQLTDALIRPFPATLDKDAYLVRTRVSTIEIDKPRILKMTLPWEHRQKRHATPTLATGTPSTGRIPGLLVLNHGDGKQGSMDVDGVRARFARDVEHFLAAIDEDETDTRSWFYLAQSLKDAGRLEEAVMTYRQRATLGGWDEEVYYSLFQVAALLERLRASEFAIVAAYLDAHNARPTRAEPLCYLARYYRTIGKHALALITAKAAVEIRRPLDRLFVDWTVYEWRSLDEVGLACFHLGRFGEARAYSQRLIGVAPPEQHFRIRRNISVCDAQVQAPAGGA